MNTWEVKRKNWLAESKRRGFRMGHLWPEQILVIPEIGIEDAIIRAVEEGLDKVGIQLGLTFDLQVLDSHKLKEDIPKDDRSVYAEDSTFRNAITSNTENGVLYIGNRLFGHQYEYGSNAVGLMYVCGGSSLLNDFSEARKTTWHPRYAEGRLTDIAEVFTRHAMGHFYGLRDHGKFNVDGDAYNPCDMADSFKRGAEQICSRCIKGVEYFQRGIVAREKRDSS